MALTFGQMCSDCMVLNPGELVSNCLSSPASRYERNYGLMLLSRKPLTDTRASGFLPESQIRGYLEATVSQLVTKRQYNNHLLVAGRWCGRLDMHPSVNYSF